MTFDDFWSNQYTHPENRGDKLRAKVRFERIAAAGDLPNLMNALGGYVNYQKNNKWYHPAQLSTWLGGKTQERWREFMTDKRPFGNEGAYQFSAGNPPSLSPLVKESEIQERALGIQRDMAARQKWWDADLLKHTHDGFCQYGKVCRFADSKRPQIRDLQDILAAIRSESV